MSGSERRLRRYVEALLRDRRPRRGATPEDAGAMRLAARLRAAHPGAGEPSAQFVDELARRLRREAGQAEAAPRRQFLAAAGIAALAGAGAGFGVERLREALGAAAPAAQEAIVPAEGSWVAIATAAELPPGAVRRFSAGGLTGFAINAAGSLRAVSAICTDQGCVLDADAERGRLVCPCHYATFTLQGLPETGTAYAHRVTPLPTISIRAHQGEVQVFVPRVS